MKCHNATKALFSSNLIKVKSHWKIQNDKITFELYDTRLLYEIE